MKMNATIMPNEYRGKITECIKLIEKANKTLGNPNEKGITCPIIFYDDLDSLQNELSEAIGKVSVFIESLKDSSKKIAYMEAIEKMEEIRNEIQEKRKEINKGNLQDALTIAKKGI